ncbi:MAG: TRAP transporter large permease subunit [Saprospiraceae bacterium]
MEWMALVLFGLVFFLILSGYPVAITLGGLSVIFGSIFLGPEFFELLPLRMKGIMENVVLIAVPLFIFMGIMLEKSGLAESMLSTMARLFGRFRGGLAISVIIVGALLAASTGIVGATVVTMGLISLPIMLKKGYSAPLATGTIAASGTLGQIIPPSIVLVLLADTLSNYSGAQVVDVGAMFSAAIGPGILLVAIYILYVIGFSIIKPEAVPVHQFDLKESEQGRSLFIQTIKAFVLPFVLIIAVLGSIFKGIASPTEAAAIGAFGATILTVGQGKFNFQVLKDVMKETTLLTSMVFFILLGATTFSLVFRGMGGDRFLVDLILDSELSPYVFLGVVMVVIFIAGFFIDFIEIIFIIVPVVAPVFAGMQMDLIWIGVLIALNLQTSFLTPPFGFSLFYLKGVAPKDVSTKDIYKGIIPFVIIQLVFLFLVIVFPELLNIFSF